MKIVQISVIALIISGLCNVVSAEPGRHVSPYPITKVDHGIKVVLTKAKRISKDTVEYAIKIDLSTLKSRGIAYEYGSTLVNGKNFPGQCGYYITYPDLILLEGQAKLPASVKNITISQEMCRLSHFRFAGIKPHSLPTRRKIGGAEVILRKVYENKAINSKRWWDHIGKGRYYAIELETKPAMITNMKFHYRAGRSSEASSSDGSWNNYGDLHAVLADNNGRKVSVKNVTYDKIAADRQSGAFNKAINSWNMSERIVHYISPKTAGHMVERRAISAARTARNRDIYLYVFPAINPLPKHFTLDMDVMLNKKPANRRWIVFKNVPVS